MTPYYVAQTSRGYAVACEAHVLTEGVKEEEARALAKALNDELVAKASYCACGLTLSGRCPVCLSVPA